MLLILLNVIFLLASQTNQSVTVNYLESIPYPSVARDAQIQGIVEIDADISPSGQVISATAKSGHPALKYAAEENIKRWRFASASAERRFSIFYEFTLEEPRMPYGSDTKNYFELPSKVKVVTNLRSRTD
jgi:TonB family protein